MGAFNSLVIATDVDVLSTEAEVQVRDGYVVVRSPDNPSHHFGNFLVFPRPPETGDRTRWELAFADEFAIDPLVRHVCITWDTVAGELGVARDEFGAAGYEVEETAGLIAAPSSLVRAHARENKDVIIRELDPTVGVAEDSWDEVIELQVATREPGHKEQDHRDFTRRRMRSRRELFRAGRGGWFGAYDPASGALTSSCGIVVTEGRGRYQAVDTDERWRRLGICSRLVVEVARAAEERYGARQLVIAADRNYHAMGLYESLGFQRAEAVTAVCWWPTAPRAGLRDSAPIG